MRFTAIGLLLAAAGVAAADEPVTFTKHVAPLLWKNCAGCHHQGHVGPFPLVTYKDAAKRADFLRDITASRRMPPWRAEPNFGHFRNERRLSDADLQTLARWAAAGAPEGDARDLPPLPKFPTGWQLGEPDLVVKMPEPFPIPADGPDVYRCFVFPLPVDRDRTVAAVEFKGGNGAVIHHAAFYLDDKGQARKKDRQDGLPGYTSFGGPGIVPRGGLGGWGLANLPKFLPEGTGMILPKGCDLIMQIHYHPNGKSGQTDQSELGIHFSKTPATKFVTTLQVRQMNISIPPGDKRHRVTCDSAPLTADVTVLYATPHMHFLGREVKCTATLPDGKTVPLVWVKDWDFHWHENYYFVEPLRLPKGTVVHVEAYYDNSADNPKNPNSPPKLVKYGNNLTDEMLSCHLQVVCDSREALVAIDGMKNSRYGPGSVPSK